MADEQEQTNVPEEADAPIGDAPNIGEDQPGAPGGDPMPPTPEQDQQPKDINGELTKIAQDYAVPMSTHALREWAKTLEGKDLIPFVEYVKKLAIGLYPTFAKEIEAGIPTKALLDPYVMVHQQAMGPQADPPNWSDPKWSVALTGGRDGQTERPVPMSLDEWKRHIMTNPAHGWDKTPAAHAKAQEFVQALNDGFGGKGGA